MRAISGEPKKDGLSQPSQRAKRAIGPKRNSSIDLPIIQLTATGESISGNRNATRKNLRARISRVEQQREPEGDCVFHKDRQAIPDHVA